MIVSSFDDGFALVFQYNQLCPVRLRVHVCIVVIFSSIYARGTFVMSEFG